jgi:hypothetical protein
MLNSGGTIMGLWRCWGDIRVSICDASPCLETSELPARDVRDLERGPFAGRAATTLRMGLVYLKSSLEVDSRERDGFNLIHYSTEDIA